LSTAAVIDLMKLANPIPRAVGLGNYESWSNADEWLAEFERLGVDVMENEVRLFGTAKGPESSFGSIHLA
jgi:hypothetical protein